MSEPKPLSPLSKGLLGEIRDLLRDRTGPDKECWREGEDLELLGYLDEVLYESTGLYSGEEER